MEQTGNGCADSQREAFNGVENIRLCVNSVNIRVLVTDSKLLGFNLLLGMGSLKISEFIFLNWVKLNFPIYLFVWLSISISQTLV